VKNSILIQPPGLLKKIYPKAIWHLNRNEKTIYLTFDDGPIPQLTDWVLQELQAVNAKATFFCVGENVVKHPEIFNRIKLHGHAVANHTMHHVKGFKNTLNDYLKEIEECESLTKTKLFRPPYGQLKRSQYKALIERNYKVIFWDVISYDYENISEQNCAKKVMSHTKNGSVILFHDNFKAEKNLKYTLPLLLKHFTELNYTFKSLN
jgi:peptidoglycan-N-acetylglucosamine deacetylase